MKIGEYFILKNYITLNMLNEALKKQRNDKCLRLGEILVKMEAFSEEELKEYVNDFVENVTEANPDDADEWLTQDQVDELFGKYSNKKKS
ncbi:MAG: hypothetical protein ACUZ8H_04990 [Candidatus Anammoxibacter sp.]